MPEPRSDFSTGSSSDSATAKSPSTTALSSLPAKADQVLTPIDLPTGQPQEAFVWRPIDALNMPSLAAPFTPSAASTLAASMLLLAGSASAPDRDGGFGVFLRISAVLAIA